MAFLDATYFGSTILQYLVFAGVILAAILAGKIFAWAVENIFKQFTKKTKNQLDDIIVHNMKNPFVFLLFIGAIYFGKTILSMSEGAASFHDNVVYIFFIFDIAWFLVGVIDSFIVGYIKPATSKTKTKMDDTLIPVVRKLVKILIYAITIIMVLDNVGVNVASLVAGLGLGGLAFALAAQDLLKNLFGGTAILTDKPFHIGQRIKVGTDIDGFVEEIGMRTTRVRTFDGTYIIVPNSRIADSIIENVSKEENRRIVQTLGVEYSTTLKKMEQAKKLLKDIVKKNPDTKDDSLVFFDEFANSSLNIKLIYWIRNKDNILGAKDSINLAIKKEFEKARIEFAYPSQTVYVKR
jgi:MscS family membrane protein